MSDHISLGLWQWFLIFLVALNPFEKLLKAASPLSRNIHMHIYIQIFHPISASLWIPEISSWACGVQVKYHGLQHTLVHEDTQKIKMGSFVAHCYLTECTSALYSFELVFSSLISVLPEGSTECLLWSMTNKLGFANRYSS